MLKLNWPYMNFKRVVLIFLTIFLLENNSKAQCDYIAGHSCATAPVICDLTCLDGFEGTLLDTSSIQVKSNFGNQPETICNTGGTPQNMSWFAFVAGSNYAKITITSFDCLNQGDPFKEWGIQAGLFGDCNFSDDKENEVPIDAEFIACDNSASKSSPIILESNKLIPGQAYYFYVDGADADICKYRVNVTDATQFTNVLSIKGFAQNKNQDTVRICPGTTQKLSVENFKLDINYYWKIDPPTSAYPYANYTKLDSVASWTFPIEGVYTISMNATNGCDTTNTISKTYIVKNSENENFGEVEWCENKFPYAGPLNEDPNKDGVIGWQGPNITAPGVSNYNVNIPNGCKYTQTVNVIGTIEKPATKVLKVDCVPFIYEGYFVDQNVSNINIRLGTTDDRYCDSLISLDAYILDIKGSVIPQNCNDGKVIVGFSPTIISAPAGYKLNYIWKSETGSILSDNDSDPSNIQISGTMNVLLDIELEYNGQICTFNIPSLFVDPSNQLPSAPVSLNWPIEICEDAFVQNLSITPLSGLKNVYWTIDNGGVIVGNVNSQNIQIDLKDVKDIVNICVKVENNCGVSPEICRSIKKLKIPVLEIENSVTLCEGDSHKLCIKNGFDPTHTYTFISTGGTLTGNSPSSACPFEMNFPESGNFIMVVKGQNKNCVSADVSQSIEVLKKQSNPIITYTPFAKKIDVSWTKLDCVKEYRYFVDNAFAGITSDNFISINDLQPGYELNFRVEAISENCACGIGIGNAIIKTLKCSELSLSILPSQNVFCENDWNKPVSLESLVTGSNGKGELIWIGKGIDKDGIFTPSLAGVGSAMIKAKFEEDGCIYQDSVKMNMIKNPDAELQTTDPQCEYDEMGSLEVISNIADQLRFLLDGKTMNQPFENTLGIGSHTIQIIDANNCSVLKSFEINKPEFPEISIIHSDRAYYDNENIPLSIKTSSNSEIELIDSIHWFINGTLMCKGKCMELNLSNVAAGTYKHEIVIFYKTCLKEESFEVLVKGSPQIFLSNIISITGSDENKYFNIKSNDPELKVKSCKVFSRWGEKVFEKLDFNPALEKNMWDGTFNGKSLNPGVFVLEIIYNDEKGRTVKTIKDLTIIK